MSTIDLHMHSNVSIDGEFPPAEVVRLSHAKGIKTMALTDHNSVRGNQDAAKEAQRLGITFIPGIEMDCTIQDTGLHLLGLGIDPTDAAFETIEQSVLHEEQQASAKQMALISDLGIHFDESKVLAMAIKGIVSPEMIAEIALQDDRNKNNSFMKPYFPGESRSENPYVNFYWDLCAPGKPAAIKYNHISLAEAIGIIHAAGGIAVLAHPGNNIGLNEHKLKQIVSLGIEGIEVFSSYHDPATTEFYQQKAPQYHLLSTVGSDFHGKTKPAIYPGCVPYSGDENQLLEMLLVNIKTAAKKSNQ